MDLLRSKGLQVWAVETNEYFYSKGSYSSHTKSFVKAWHIATIDDLRNLIRDCEEDSYGSWDESSTYSFELYVE